MNNGDEQPIRLTQLPIGSWARLVAVTDSERERTLKALGLTGRWPFLLCQAGSPWIVQVRRTRIGLTEEVASSMLVVPESPRAHNA